MGPLSRQGSGGASQNVARIQGRRGGGGMGDGDQPPKPRAFAALRDLAATPGLAPMLGSRTAQMFGYAFTPVALQVTAARTGHGTPLVVGTILFASFLPAILLGPLAGALVERWDKRQAIAWAQAARVLFVLLAVAWPGVPTFVLVGLLMGVSQAFYLPAYRALLPEIAHGDDLHMRATALSHSLEQVGSLVGTGLGAFAVVWAGVRPAFGLDAAVLAVSALCAFGLPRAFAGRAAAAPSPTGLGRQIADGFRAVAEVPLAREIVLVVGVLSVGFVMVNPLLVLIPRTMLHAPVWWFGVFELAQALAMAALGGVLAGGLRLSRRALMLGGFALAGLSVGGLGLSHSLAIDVVLYILFGFANMAFVTPALALYRLQFPLEIRARASAVYSTAMGVAQALGVALGGAVATVFSVQDGILAAGGWVIVVTAATAALGLLTAADAPSPVVAAARS